MRLFYKIERMFNYIRYDIPYGLRNLWNWFPVIWNHRSWDAVFSLMVLKKSLTEVRDTIERNARHLGYEKDVRRMTVAIECLKRILEEDDFSYTDMVFDKHDKKWGELEFSFKDVEGTNGNLSETIFSRDNVNTKEDEEQEEKEYKWCSERERKLRQQDIDILFDTMKHFRKWWD